MSNSIFPENAAVFLSNGARPPFAEGIKNYKSFFQKKSKKGLDI